MVPIASLSGEPRRPIDLGHVARLAQNIEAGGLLHPITVTPPPITVVAGFHRLEAFRLLGRTHIPAQVRELSDLEREFIQISENVERLPLTKLQMAVQLAKAQNLYEILFPVTKAGSSEKNGSNRRGVARSERPPSFAAATAAQIKQSERNVQRYTQIGKHLNPDVVAPLTGSEIENNRVRLADISLLPQHEQVPVVSLLLSEDGPKTVTEALRLVRGEQSQTDPAEAPTTEQAAATFVPQPSVLHRASALACKAQGIDLHALGITVGDALDGGAHVQIALPAPTDESDLLTALRVISELDAEISRVKSILTTTDVAPAEWKQFASAADLATVRAGQMQAAWLVGQSGIEISRGVPLAQIPVVRAAKSGTYVKAPGNTKSLSAISILNGLSQGCLRGGTGFGKCEQCCYCIHGKTTTGCFAATNQYTIHGDIIGSYDICTNGWQNNLLTLRLPKNGDFRLDADPAWGPIGRRIWRVDSESSDASLSISLGLLQMWAESNPDHLFFGISANYFEPSSAMLRWLAALPNVWVLHSVSAWLSPDELDSRFQAIERFIAFGVPTAISIVTSPDFADNEAVLERALKLVPAERIVQAPHQIGKQFKHLPLPGYSPLGACGDNRYDHEGHLVRGEYADDGKIRYYRHLPDSSVERARGVAHPRCVGCRVLCGATGLGFCDAAKLAPPPLVLDSAAGDAAPRPVRTRVTQSHDVEWVDTAAAAIAVGDVAAAGGEAA